MCGIAGIKGRLSDPNRAALRRMTDAMAHRGPDGQGAWESAPDLRGRGVLLGHRRLAILDLSPSAAQPMVDPSTGHAIVFNGEIYNFQDLREGLAAAGEEFGSTGDTAVLLRLLSRQGAAALPRLRGMFAFASWDPARRALLLARDPLGIKPLYLARNPDPDGEWSLAFASEVRALLASGLLGAPRLSAEAAAAVVWNGFVPGPLTAVRGIELLGPGELCVADGAQTGARTRWTVPGPDGSAAPMDEPRLSSVLEECLRLHRISDVPLAVFLSSGVDSSAVANLAQRAAQGPVHTFTLSFEDASLDEGPAARQIAAAIGAQHQEVLLTEQEVVDHLPAALDAIDQPTFDGLNSYFMSLAVRRAGFKVALVGTGGDELFGGYPTFRELPLLHRWSRRTRWLPKGLLAAAARRAAALLQRGAFPAQTRWAKLPSMLARGGDLLSLYQLAYALFLPELQEELLLDRPAALVDGLPAELQARLLGDTAHRSDLAAVGAFEQRLFLGERLLRDNDAASMAASIEQRLPLVDSVLFDAVDRLPDAARFAPPGRKALLRRIGLRGLDPRLFERPKRGFVLPFDRWIRRGMSGAMNDCLRDPEAVRAAGLSPAAVLRVWEAFLAGARGVYWSRVWALFVLVRWCQRNGVRR